MTNENGDLLVVIIVFLFLWKNYISKLVNIHAADEVREPDIHTAKLLVPGPSFNEDGIAIAKLKCYKTSSNDSVPAQQL